MTSGLYGSEFRPVAPARNAWKQELMLRHCPSGQFSVESLVPLPGWLEAGGTEYASESSARLLRCRFGCFVSSELVFVIAQRPIVFEAPSVLPDSSPAVELRKNSVPPNSWSNAAPGASAGQIVKPVLPLCSRSSFVLLKCSHGTDASLAARRCF